MQEKKVQRKTNASREQLSTRIPEDLLDQLREIAEAEDRTVSGQIVRALREWLKQRNGGKSNTPTSPPPGMRPVAPAKLPPPSVVEQVMSDDPEGWEGGPVKAK